MSPQGTKPVIPNGPCSCFAIGHAIDRLKELAETLETLPAMHLARRWIGPHDGKDLRMAIEALCRLNNDRAIGSTQEIPDDERYPALPREVAWSVHKGDTPPAEEGTEWCVAKVGIAVACKPVSSAADLPPTFDDHDPTSFNVFGTSPAAVARHVAEKIQQSFDTVFDRNEHLGN